MKPIRITHPQFHRYAYTFTECRYFFGYDVCGVLSTGHTPEEAFALAAERLGKPRSELDPEQVREFCEDDAITFDRHGNRCVRDPLSALAILRCFIWKEKTGKSHYLPWGELDDGAMRDLREHLGRKPTSGEVVLLRNLIDERIFQGRLEGMISGSNPAERQHE